MIQIRSFLNTDPPRLVSVWNSQPENKRLARQMKVATFEHFVLAKPYFDRDGVLIAVVDGEVVGFAHAGFGPNADNSHVDLSTGVLCLLQIRPEHASDELQSQLLAAAEQYLVSKGARRIIAGPISPFACFYHGLSSLGESAGVLAPDGGLRQAIQNAGYSEATQNIVLHRDLTAFRPPFDRKQRALQRSYEAIVELDTDLSNWWELCRYGPLPRCGFRLIEKDSRCSIADVSWWDQAFTGAALQSTVSFTGIHVPDERRRQGLGTLLMNESMKQLKASGAFFASAQVDATNESGLAFFQSLGFKEIERGTTYSKDVAPIA